MKIQKSIGMALALLLVSVMPAQAASIWLNPTGPTNIGVGGTVTFEIMADASDVGGFLAGGVDLFYDNTILQYNDDFAFDPAFGQDPAFSRVFDNCSTTPGALGCAGPNELNSMGFGLFTGIAGGGPTLVGSLSFTGLSLGLSTLVLADNDLPAGGWFSNGGDDLTGLVTYTGSQVNVVPLPAAAWLMLGGLGMLWKMGRGGKQEAA